MLSSAFSSAQNVVHIEFPVSHRFATFVAPKLPESMPRVLDEHEGTATQVEVPATGDLYLWDREAGNVAVKPVAKAGPTWKVKDSDFSLIGRVTVHVEYQGRPVQTAQVNLKDSARSQGELIAGDSGGDADFSLVKPGDLLVTVKYRSNGADAPLLKQVYNLSIRRDEPDPVLRVAVPVETATVYTAKSGAPPPASRISPNPLGSFIVVLLGLGIAGYAGWWMYQRAKKNPQWVADRMKQLGVDLPQPAIADGAAPDGGVADLEPPKPKAPTKILLEDSEPTPIGGVASSPSGSAIEPRLIRDTGEFTILREGETEVGREPGLGLSLAGESSVSRRHAVIVRSGSDITVRDLQSTNGTFVNGKKVGGETPIRVGDEVQFGSVRFRVQ